MALINKPYTFSAGATIVAAEHNSNFDTIYNEFNGLISNANISPSAAITDSKLAQLTTAGKVSGASLTLLGSIPSGAGVVPIANLATGTPSGAKFIRDDGTLATPTTAATQAEMETGSSITVSVTPGRQQYHPSSPKAWCMFNGVTTGTNAPTAGYNVTSVTRNGTGNYTITFTVAMSSSSYCVVGSAEVASAGSPRTLSPRTLATGTVIIRTGADNVGLEDCDIVCVTVFGDQ